MRIAGRRVLRELYPFRCGYCGTSEIDAGGEVTVDHFQPQPAGRAESAENWVYACIICNDYKGDHWNPTSAERILHPRRDPLPEHIHEKEDGVLVPLTETGRFHIQRLRLNRPQLVAPRQRNRELQWFREERCVRIADPRAVQLRQDPLHRPDWRAASGAPGRSA